MVEYIDASNLIAGRLASHAARLVLEGENVVIVNAEKAVVTGPTKSLDSKFRERRERGEPFQGPFYPRMPDRILRRMVRGMLPMKTTRGKEAFRRVMVWIGVPDKQKEHKFKTIDKYNADHLKTLNYSTLETITKKMGAKF